MPESRTAGVRPTRLENADQEAVFAFLQSPQAHLPSTAVERIDRIDTHGAVVFLAGENAYKVKRAVRYSFMDFSTLAKRLAVCRSEIAVNRANAPDIYLGVVPIIRMGEGLKIGPAIDLDAKDVPPPPSGQVVEWAVHMRRFDESATLDRLAGEGRLPAGIAAKLASAVARAHERAPILREQGFVTELGLYIARNAQALAAHPDVVAPARVAELKAAGATALEALRPLLLARCRAGFVRRCHGDLHLRNIVLIDGEPVPFDAIEFDESIATIDILYDLAFLLMDLWQRGLRHEANAVLNRYLWQRAEEADIAGLAALPLFLSIRAGVRAMVATATFAHVQGEVLAQSQREAADYATLAERFIAPAQTRMLAIGGLSGTGKSVLAANLAPDIGHPVGAVHLRSDIERKALFGVAETDKLPPAAYTQEVTAQVYARLRHLARITLDAGQSVIVDAVHARPEERDQLEEIAHTCGVRFDGLWLETSAEVREARVEARTGDASDADANVVRTQSGYDAGDIGWRRLSASGAPEAVAASARAALGLVEAASQR